MQGSEVIVSFVNEEVISAGTQVSFSLKATAVGTEMNDVVTTFIRAGDDALPLTGLTWDTNPNTGRLVAALNTVGLFQSLYDFQAAPSYPNHDVVWKDHSNDFHNYSLGESESSYDFTNGFGLGIWDLAPVSLAKN